MIQWLKPNSSIFRSGTREWEGAKGIFIAALADRKHHSHFPGTPGKTRRPVNDSPLREVGVEVGTGPKAGVSHARCVWDTGESAEKGFYVVYTRFGIKEPLINPSVDWSETGSEKGGFHFPSFSIA